MTAGDARVTSGNFIVTHGVFSLFAGSFDATQSSGTFATGGGQHTLNGNALVNGEKSLIVGKVGTAGATTLYGTLTVRASVDATSTTLYGPREVNTGGLTVTADGAVFTGGFSARALVRCWVRF